MYEHILDKKEKSEVKDMLHELVTKLIEDYHEEWVRAGIPGLVITKFDEYHSENIEWVRNAIDAFMDNDWETIVERVYSIFRIFANAYNKAFMEANSTFSEMNGDLDGLEFNGSICESGDEDLIKVKHKKGSK